MFEVRELKTTPLENRLRTTNTAITGNLYVSGPTFAVHHRFSWCYSIFLTKRGPGFLQFTLHAFYGLLFTLGLRRLQEFDR